MFKAFYKFFERLKVRYLLFRNTIFLVLYARNYVRENSAYKLTPRAHSRQTNILLKYIGEYFDVQAEWLVKYPDRFDALSITTIKEGKYQLAWVAVVVMEARRNDPAMFDGLVEKFTLSAPAYRGLVDWCEFLYVKRGLFVNDYYNTTNTDDKTQLEKAWLQLAQKEFAMSMVRHTSEFGDYDAIMKAYF